jgi:hypothetical protein
MIGLFSAIGRELDADGWIMWYRVLMDLPLSCLDQAIVRWLSENDSGFPTPAALRRLALEYRDGEDGTYCDVLEDFFRTKRRFDPFYAGDQFMRALQPLTRRCVASLGGCGWAADLMVADRPIWTAQLREVAKTLLSREQSLRRLPEELRPRLRVRSETAGLLAERMSVPQGVVIEAEAESA